MQTWHNVEGLPNSLAACETFECWVFVFWRLLSSIAILRCIWEILLILVRSCGMRPGASAYVCGRKLKKKFYAKFSPDLLNGAQSSFFRVCKIKLLRSLAVEAICIQWFLVLFNLVLLNHTWVQWVLFAFHWVSTKHMGRDRLLEHWIDSLLQNLRTFCAEAHSVSRASFFSSNCWPSCRHIKHVNYNTAYAYKFSLWSRWVFIVYTKFYRYRWPLQTTANHDPCLQAPGMLGLV